MKSKYIPAVAEKIFSFPPDAEGIQSGAASGYGRVGTEKKTPRERRGVGKVTPGGKEIISRNPFSSYFSKLSESCETLTFVRQGWFLTINSLLMGFPGSPVATSFSQTCSLTGREALRFQYFIPETGTPLRWKHAFSCLK